MAGNRGGIDFVIWDPDCGLTIVGGSDLFESIVPYAELQIAWEGIRHAW